MLQILVYGDSLTWGIIPNTRRRLPFEERWPIVMEHELQARGRPVRVIEDCLNGRRTVWDDPFKPGRSGMVGIEQRIEANSPLALVILMLGSNDFQSMHPHVAWHASQGIAALVRAIRRAPVEPGMPVPPILIVAPPPLKQATGAMGERFAGADAKCEGLAEAYEQVAIELGCGYVDAGSIVSTSSEDGVHLDADQHATLGRDLAAVVSTMLAAVQPA